MPTNFPTGVDNFTNPTANDSLNIPSHSLQHSNANDAIEAIETYLLDGANKIGMTHINTTSFVTQTNIQINNVFSSAYDNYFIEVNFSSNTSVFTYFNLSSNGTPDVGNNHNRAGWLVRPGGTSGTYYAAVNTNVFVAGDNFRTAGAINLYSPAITVNTFMTGVNVRDDGEGATYWGRLNTTSAYDGIRFTSSSGTSLLTGSIRIYGLRNS